MLPPLSKDEMRASVSSLRGAVSVGLASALYHKLSHMGAPRFMARRLHIPCTTFSVSAVGQRRSDQEQDVGFTYGVKADGLYDLLITTEDKLIQLLRARPTRSALLLVRPWDRNLLELSDFENDIEGDMQSMHEFSMPAPPEGNDPVHSGSEFYYRGPQLIGRLRHPFSAVFDSLGRIPGKK